MSSLCDRQRPLWIVLLLEENEDLKRLFLFQMSVAFVVESAPNNKNSTIAHDPMGKSSCVRFSRESFHRQVILCSCSLLRERV